MAEPLPVELVLEGPAFDPRAVRHTLRHLALVMGWRLTPGAPRRLVYATGPGEVTDRRPADVVVLSSEAVARHLEAGEAPVPLARDAGGETLPFPHPNRPGAAGPTVIPGDVVAGAHAVMNLWFERRTRRPGGPIRFADDWWTRAGFDAPAPVADRWLGRIVTAAKAAGWPAAHLERRDLWGHGRYAVVVSHDVDYLPGPRDRGLPRFARALVRHLVFRRRPGDALAVGAAYAAALARRTPYFELPSIQEEEGRRGVRSSFQFTVARHHRADPAYSSAAPRVAEAITGLRGAGFEVGLHGSFRADAVPGRLAEERARLASIGPGEVAGYRQHYLSFHPTTLFRELERAGFGYDSSVGYNDASGPRSGTLFPYRPYDMERGRPHRLWEIPLILMDTTLALSDRLAAPAAGERLQAVTRGLAAAGGAGAVNWHQEQLGGLLDPGYDRIYFDWLDGAIADGAWLTAGGAMLDGLDTAWRSTVGAG